MRPETSARGVRILTISAVIVIVPFVVVADHADLLFGAVIVGVALIRLLVTASQQANGQGKNRKEREHVVVLIVGVLEAALTWQDRRPGPISAPDQC